MCTNNLLTIEQFGFRTGHSTELAAIQLIDHLTKQMDMGKVPTNMYMCSLVVSILDSPAVDLSSNPGSGSAF